MTDPKRYRWQGTAIGGLIVAALAGAGVWAGWTVLRPADDPLAASAHTFVEVVEGEVGSELLLNTVAQWRSQPIGENQASGIVTSVDVQAGEEVSAGATLYTINLRPVVVGQGAVPAFRAISDGAKGPDVKQLQEMLITLGFYKYGADGEAGAETVSAIQAWQKSLGLEQTGQVELGDVVFVSNLPTRMSLDTEKVTTGSSLSGGEPVIQGLSSSPFFSLPVTDAQAAMIPTGTRVSMTSPSGAVWTGVASDRNKDPETGALTIAVVGADGVSICGDNCSEVPVSGQAQLASRVVTIEPVAGLVVPSAALLTDASGDAMVIDAKDQRHPVTIIESAKGMSVIEGVEGGLRVRIPADAADEAR